jgi:hypothetical protein
MEPSVPQPEVGECGFTYLLDPLPSVPESSFSTLTCGVKLFQPFFFGVACEPATRKRRILRDSEVIEFCLPFTYSNVRGYPELGIRF